MFDKLRGKYIVHVHLFQSIALLKPWLYCLKMRSNFVRPPKRNSLSPLDGLEKHNFFTHCIQFSLKQKHCADDNDQSIVITIMWQWYGVRMNLGSVQLRPRDSDGQ